MAVILLAGVVFLESSKNKGMFEYERVGGVIFKRTEGFPADNDSVNDGIWSSSGSGETIMPHRVNEVSDSDS